MSNRVITVKMRWGVVTSASTGKRARRREARAHPAPSPQFPILGFGFVECWVQPQLGSMSIKASPCSLAGGFRVFLIVCAA